MPKVKKFDVAVPIIRLDILTGTKEREYSLLEKQKREVEVRQKQDKKD